MGKNPENGDGGRMAGFLLVHAVCCGGILLLATGALGAFGAWFIEDGLTWLGSGGAAVLTAYLLWRWDRNRVEGVRYGD